VWQFWILHFNLYIDEEVKKSLTFKNILFQGNEVFLNIQLFIDQVILSDSEAKAQCIIYDSGRGYEKTQVTYLDIMR